MSRWQQAGAVSEAGQRSPGSCWSVPVWAAQPQQPHAKFAGVKLALFVIIMWSLRRLGQFVASWINLLTTGWISLACGVSC